MLTQHWKVIGGGDKGGILVRTAPDTTSPEESERLATNSIVKEIAQLNGRLNYELLKGSGPNSGWVAIKLKDKDLVIRCNAGDDIPTPSVVAAAISTSTSAKEPAAIQRTPWFPPGCASLDDVEKQLATDSIPKTIDLLKKECLDSPAAFTGLTFPSDDAVLAKFKGLPTYTKAMQCPGGFHHAEDSCFPSGREAAEERGIDVQYFWDEEAKSMRGAVRFLQKACSCAWFKGVYGPPISSVLFEGCFGMCMLALEPKVIISEFSLKMNKQVVVNETYEIECKIDKNSGVKIECSGTLKHAKQGNAPISSFKCTVVDTTKLLV